jgi:hypothetical protein
MRHLIVTICSPCVTSEMLHPTSSKNTDGSTQHQTETQESPWNKQSPTTANGSKPEQTQTNRRRKQNQASDIKRKQTTAIWSKIPYENQVKL